MKELLCGDRRLVDLNDRQVVYSCDLSRGHVDSHLDVGANWRWANTVQLPEEKHISISSISDPEAPTTTNDKGGSQSDIPVRFDLIDAKAMFEMAKVLDTGAKKYGEGNWRKIDIDDHLNHLLMHTYAYLSGDRTDDHLSHILCRATFALGVKLQEDT